MLGMLDEESATQGDLKKKAQMGEESPAAAGELKKRPHIVMFNFPAQGRMIPAIMLASRLAALGAEVSYVCPEYQLKRLGEAKARGGYNDRIRLVGLNSEVLSVMPESFMRMIDDMGSMVELFEEFLRSLPELPACVIIDEVSAEIADVVHRLKLPRYIFSPESAFAFSAVMYVRRLASDARVLLPNTPDELVQIPGTMPPLRACEFLSPYVHPGWMTDFFLAAALRAHDAEGVLINTFEELEAGTLSALRSESELNPNKLRMVAIGPLLPEEQHLSSSSSSSRPEEGLCLDFLNRHPPASVVYVSFGTIKKLTEEEVREMALGLEAAGCPFIWMLRCEAAFIPEGQGFQPPFGLVLSTWAPQLRILSHPSTGAFVTHFGWNSTLESISCGVPMLGFPGFMDQCMNRMLVVESLRVGLSVHNDAVERGAVERGVKEVLGSEEMRQRARGLRDAARRAMGIANHNLTSFIDGL